MKQSFTPIERVGRANLIRTLGEVVPQSHASTLLGMGDDAAVIRISEYKRGLLSIDTYTEMVDFDLSYTPIHHLGYKVIAAGVSDILAMNGSPVSALVSLSVPNKISVEMIQQLYRGLTLACKDNDMDLVGGDITATHGGLSITVSFYGEAEDDQVSYRSGAKIDDAILLTGDIGGAVAGLKILLKEKKEWVDEGQVDYFQPDLESHEYVVKRQLMAIARRDLIQHFHEHSLVPNAMIDISQGLVHDLQQVLEKSAVGAYLYEAAIPIHPDTRESANSLELDAIQMAIFGGEDYELLFTLPMDEANELCAQFSDVTIIGRITEHTGQCVLQTAEGQVVSLSGIGSNEQESTESPD